MIEKVLVSADFGQLRWQVGELYLLQGQIYFTYDPKFPSERFRLSPFQLSIDKTLAHTVSENHRRLFWGLIGVFGDSLPDGWGLLLIKRSMETKNLRFSDSSGLDLLSFIGHNGLGVLRYEPQHESKQGRNELVDIIKLEKESQKVLEGEGSELLNTLLKLGGSPGGARPKVSVGIKFSSDRKWTARTNQELSDGFHPWLIKFFTKEDSKDASLVEFHYMKAAAELGIEVPESHLFETNGNRFFGTKRFDVSSNGERFHLHSAAAMLHADFRLPALDYRDLLKLVSRLTNNSSDILKMYQIAVFNATFHNRDDHSKNFGFLMDQSGIWRPSPAYDLTYSEGVGGEHTTSYLGEGRNITSEILLKLASEFKINRIKAKNIIEQTKEKREDVFKEFRGLGLSKHPLLRFSH
ncbi:MAG: type II toxin-antitoxin system HipA family toxin [Proteobacteria bacterium]|nr:type II toxin-antitoxin system HipA family toxin [Pseudomonadota bacterium]